MTDVEQLSLLPGRKPCPPPDIDYVKSLPNLRRALQYARSLADLEPKQVYGPLGKDKATWSRIDNGDMSFPADELLNFCRVVGNDASVLWLNHQLGYDIAHLPRLRDDRDRRILELESQLAEERHKNQIISDFVRETRGGRS